MGLKILCEATCEVTVVESAGVCRVKCTVSKQQDSLPSATEEPYTKLL